MVRCALALVASLMFLPSAEATYGHKKRPDVHKYISLPSLALRSAASNDDYRITADTEVLLDGKPCPYDRVPDGAKIIFMETTTNLSKDITRIHFRTSPRSTSSTPPK